MFKKTSFILLFVLTTMVYSQDSLTVLGKVLDLFGNGVYNAHINTLENASTYTNINGEYIIKVSKDYVPTDNPVIIPENYKNFKIKIYNILGQKIFENEYVNNTFIEFKWDGISKNGGMVSSGIYFPIIEIDNKIIARSKVSIVGGKILNSQPFINFKSQNNSIKPVAKTSKLSESYTVNFTLDGDNFTRITDLLVNVIDEDNDGIYNADNIEINTYEIDWITDVDSNTYKVVKIGEQWWMAENLKVTHFRNGELILGVYSYDGKNFNVRTYGKLYNAFVLSDSQNVAPEGWHVPTDEDWKELEIYMGMSESDANKMLVKRGSDEGNKLKSTTLWNSNGNGIDDYGFAALPAGVGQVCIGSTCGGFNYMGHSALFWTATKYDSLNAWMRSINKDFSIINRQYLRMEQGMSVRCVKD